MCQGEGVSKCCDRLRGGGGPPTGLDHMEVSSDYKETFLGAGRVRADRTIGVVQEPAGGCTVHQGLFLEKELRQERLFLIFSFLYDGRKNSMLA